MTPPSDQPGGREHPAEAAHCKTAGGAGPFNRLFRVAVGVRGRFANPQVRDTLARLCAESSDRIPKWMVPVIQDNLAAGRPVDFAAAIVASWARYAQGVDESGNPFEIVDSRKDSVLQAAAAQVQDPLAFVRDRELFGDLVDQDEFVEAYLWALESFRSSGARATLTALLGKLGRPLPTD